MPWGNDCVPVVAWSGFARRFVWRSFHRTKSTTTEQLRLAQEVHRATMAEDKFGEKQETPWRFRSSLENHQQLLALIREVALIATDGDQDAALAVSIREWERARPHSHLPGPRTATALCKGRGGKRRPWRKMLELAFAEPSQLGVLLGREAVRVGYKIPCETSLVGIEMVAARLRDLGLEKTCALTPVVYDELVIEIERRHVRRYRQEMGLPNSETIKLQFGSWAEALRVADVKSAPKGTGQMVVDPHEAVIACLEEVGRVPPHRYIRDWARVRGYRLGVESLRLGKVLGEVRLIWEEGGRDWPEKAKYRDLPIPQPRADQERQPIITNATREDCLRSIRRYLAALDPTEYATQKHYMAMRSLRPDLHLIPASVLGRHDRFNYLVREAAGL